MPLKVTSTPHFLICSFNNSKIADVQTFDVDAKSAPVNVGSWKDKFGNHDNQNILANLAHTCATIDPITGSIV